MLTIIDEFTRECLSVDVDRRLSSHRVLERLTELFAQRDAPNYIRSDNGSKFTAKKVRRWLSELTAANGARAGHLYLAFAQPRSVAAPSGASEGALMAAMSAITGRWSDGAAGWVTQRSGRAAPPTQM